jgi:hypothetical protein
MGSEPAKLLKLKYALFEVSVKRLSLGSCTTTICTGRAFPARTTRVSDRKVNDRVRTVSLISTFFSVPERTGMEIQSAGVSRVQEGASV